MSEPVLRKDTGIALRPRKLAGGTAYVEKGSGEAILFIHGVGLNGDAWGPQIDAFGATHHVIAIDLLGHGASTPPKDDATLDCYIEQVTALLDHLKIDAATIVGHSMGGLVALGFALRFPGRTLRLAVLNSVYNRDAARREAVETRARDIAEGRSSDDIEEPLRRWFGPDYGRLAGSPAAQVREWLSSVDRRSYAIAYHIFASSDDAFSGHLANLAMPALFATGALDPNSTPEMTLAMAKAAPRGRAIVLDGERHMMNLTSPAAVNDALRSLLSENVRTIDPRDLRTAFGTFMTGVTIITTIASDRSPRGFTANSFTSVSLEPPLLLVCIGKAASSCATFSDAPGFAVNILSEQQKDISGVFASRRADKFAGVSWHKSNLGNPLIDGTAAWFDCARHALIDAGDHVILIGRVEDYAYCDANPLGYARGGYVTLGLEQMAVNAAAQGGRTVVGAILESDGRLVLMPGTDPGSLMLPEAGREGAAGSGTGLKSQLATHGVDVSLGFLFAVFENPNTRTQFIYYRGEARLREESDAILASFDSIPWERIPDEAVRVMLRRYANEREQGRFNIYSGDHERGEVRALGE